MNQENLEQLETKSEETKSEEKGGWVNTLAKGLALAPILLEQFTNQKLPVVGGILGDIQQTISQLAVNIQQLGTTVVNNQNKIWQKLTSLENNAQQKLVNLTNKVDKISTVRLTSERERKQIEYNPKHLENQEFE